MDAAGVWFAAAATVGVVLAYEAWLTVAQRIRPERLARSAHAALPSV